MSKKREPNARGQGEQLREQLVAAASELLLMPQSVALPSLRAVARRCAVSPAAVYLHFDSQAALLGAVLDAQLASLRDSILAAVPTDGEPEALLDAFGVAYARWGMAHPGGYQLLFESADQFGTAHSAGDEEGRWELIEVGTGLVAASTGVDDADARPLAFQLWAGLHGIVSLRLHKPQLAWPTSLEDEVAALMRSISSRALPTANRPVSRHPLG